MTVGVVVHGGYALQAAAAGPTATDQPSLTTSTFDGVQRDGDGPPNVQVAVGPRYIAELSVSSFDVWSRSDPGGTPIFHENDCTWAGIHACGDTRLIYDAVSGRFFATILGVDGVTIGVSATSDPAGAWYFDSTDIVNGLDQPRLAVTADKVIIGDNGDRIWVFQKSDFLAATADPMTARFTALVDDDNNSVYGAIDVEVGDPSSPDGWVLTRGGTDTTAAVVARLSGTPTAGDVRLTRTLVHLTYPWADPLLAPQQGGPDPLQDDFYAKQGVLAAGSLWFAMDEPCTPPGDTSPRDCTHLAQIDVSGALPAFVHESEISVPGENLLDPAVAVDGQGRPIVVATETGSDMYASVVAIPLRADGVQGAPTMLRPGQAYTISDHFTPAPGLAPEEAWGDYSAAVSDPNDPSTVWLAGEFAYSLGKYGTSITSASITDPDCPQTTTCAPGSYRALTPTRVLDTRGGVGHSGPVAPGASVTLPVTTIAGIPTSGVSAVALNLTVTSPTRAGYINAYPDGTSPPATSNLNFSASQTVANLILTGVGADGRVTLVNHSSGSVQLIADTAGYYLGGQPTAPGTFTALPAARVLDTRIGTAARGPVTTAHPIRLHLTGTGGIPASGVSAVALNVTATAATQRGDVSTYPDTTTPPATSNLNFAAGQTVANLVIAGLGADGSIDLHADTTGTVQLVADIVGYYRAGQDDVPGALTTQPPTRVLDTRTGLGAPKTAVPPGATVSLNVDSDVPADHISTVAVNVTVTTPQRAGFINVYPDGTTAPATSNLNFAAGQTAANLVLTPLGAHGHITLHNGSTGTVQLVADIAGYWN